VRVRACVCDTETVMDAAAAAVAAAGRTVEFVFDQTLIPIIGTKYWDGVATTCPKLDTAAATTTSTTTTATAAAAGNAATTTATNSGSGSRTTTTTTTTNSSENVSSWKRPASSQV